jgi:NADH-quinone oxidoreductase subunit J
MVLKARVRLLIAVIAALILAGVAELFVFAALGPMRGLFVQIAGAGILCALGTVLARNLIHAALYLFAMFFLVACVFVLLEAEFLAVMQVLVYIGAVAILLMFGIMLTQNVQGDETTATAWWRRLPAAIVAIGLFAMLVIGSQQRPAPSASLNARAQASIDAREISVNRMTRDLGLELMERWCLPFELAGLLLTAALVGAVALARPREVPAPPHSRRTDRPVPIPSPGPEPAPAPSPAPAPAREPEPVAAADTELS